MIIRLNDNFYKVDEGTTLAAFIRQMGYQPQGLAAAIGNEVVPKSEWATTILQDKMELVLVQAVSGG